MSRGSLPWLATAQSPRRRLTLDAIVGTGLEILATAGVEAVTMRAVAAKLGTGAASLYAHVRDKNQLHELMLDRVLAEVQVPARPDPRRWQQQVKSVLRSHFQALQGHPGIAAVNIGHIPTGPEALRVSNAMLAILKAGGLSEDAAGLAMDLLFLYPTSVAFEESVWRRRGLEHPEMSEMAVVQGLEHYFATLDANRYPYVVALARSLTAGTGADRFDFGLDVLVAGLSALKDWRLRRRRRGSSTG